MRRVLEQYRPARLEAGQSVPSFTAEGLDSTPVNVTYDGSGPKKVFLFFTPTCPYCRQQFAYWRELLERVDAERFEVIGVVAQSEDKPRLSEYLRTMGCTDEARTRLRVALAPDDVRQSYQLAATPITLIVNNDGLGSVKRHPCVKHVLSYLPQTHVPFSSTMFVSPLCSRSLL
jgi:thiol-disulfide isomerase/thioredoxin